MSDTPADGNGAASDDEEEDVAAPGATAPDGESAGGDAAGAAAAGTDGDASRGADTPAGSGTGGVVDRLWGRLRDADRATRGVAAITAVALLARLVVLGNRSLHFDEARVAYWALNFERTGAWHYRPIVHGPLIQHVDRWLFVLLGPSDAVMRLPVAVVGGLLPLSVLLYRRHFSDTELFGVALVLAANPLLLYYSRFMRSDVLVAAFMFVMLGFLVRLWDRRQPRDLYLALAFGALGFASKENAIIYPVCWVGMVGAVGGMELLYPRRFETRTAFLTAARDRGEAWFEWALSAGSRRWVGHLVGAAILFAAVTVFLYAPRGYVYAPDRPVHWVRQPGAGLWGGGNTIQATIGGIQQGFEKWTESGNYVGFCSGGEGELLRQYAEPETFKFEYLCYLGRELVILQKGALAVAALSVIGFAREWVDDHPRLLVTGAFAWGIASVLGYPAGSDIFYPAWIAVHVVVPLAIPGGVGLALLARWGRESLADDDVVGTAIAVGAAALLVTSMVGVAAHHSYVAPQAGSAGEVNVAQYAQPADDLDALSAAIAGAADGEGVNVVVYGPTSGRVTSFVDGDRRANLRPACVRWLIPMAPASWYLYRDQPGVRCAGNESAFARLYGRHDPAVVITSEPFDDRIAGLLADDYVRLTFRLRLGDSPARTAVVYVDTSRVDVDATASGR